MNMFSRAQKYRIFVLSGLSVAIKNYVILYILFYTELFGKRKLHIYEVISPFPLFL